MKNLTLDKALKRGDRGAQPRLVQEWLTLQGFAVVVDGDFGPATDVAVRDFQKRKGLAVDGVVGKNTFKALSEPMQRVLASIAPKSTLGATVVAYAKQHLKAHPREVGGQNKGPWVRLYMDGNEGADFPWCAGFVCFLLKQACDAHKIELPIEPSVSCDSLAASAKRESVFLSEKDAKSTSVRPGSFFLVRRTDTDWTHVGIVTRDTADIIETVEGNTNDEGSREGFEVCARKRGYKSKDFIRI